MPELMLRQATIADASAIRDLTQAAYASLAEMLGYPPRPMLADYNAAVRAHRFDLLFKEAQLVALIETTAKDDHYLVVNVAVLPGLQGGGTGTRLMAHAEMLAIAAGFDDIRLYTNVRFGQNIRLYRSLGYQPYKEEDFGNGIAVHMRKTLASRPA